LNGHEVVLAEVDQETELGRQDGHGVVTLDPEDVQMPVVDLKDVSDG